MNTSNPSQDAIPPPPPSPPQQQRQHPTPSKTNLAKPTYNNTSPPEAKYPTYYFFYGTLKSGRTLTRILDIPPDKSHEPHLRSAQIKGFALGKWGDYPALISGTSEQTVSGSAYLIQSEEQARKLAEYETKAYKVADCLIFFTDNKSPAEEAGKTFMYAGDEKTLLEQRFDRKLWELQMGRRLG